MPQGKQFFKNNIYPLKFYLFIYFNFFVAELGLRCFMWAFPSCSVVVSGSYSLVAVCGLLIAVASLVVVSLVLENGL